MDPDENLARQLQAEEFELYNAPIQKQTEFRATIQAGVKQVLQYESSVAQQAARDAIPLAAMRDSIADAAQLARDMGDLPPIDDRIALVTEMLTWFKTEFFSWVDTPVCDGCQSIRVDHRGTAPPTVEESRSGAGLTETYKCTDCGRMVRFARYNEAVKLLSTRRGRCGEWSNCFCLCLRAAGFDARWVTDLQDHVWCEYWAEADERWVHVDPCEGAHDTPLLYERGWGKQQAYVIAFGKDGVADVSRRYTANATVSYRRRTEVSEAWLADQLHLHTQQLRGRQPHQENITAAVRRDLEKKDLDRLGQPQGTPPTNLPGRTTGSKAWREARGEDGADQQEASAVPWRRALTVFQTSASGMLCGAIRASGQHAPAQTAIKAFDGKPGTKWLDFGAGSGAPVWLETAVIAPVTSVRVTSYALTSAEDAEERDPTTWVLEGLPWQPSHERAAAAAVLRGTANSAADLPSEWAPLDVQHNVVFAKRGAVIRFQVENAPLCTRIRLTITAVQKPAAANSVQLNSLLFYCDEHNQQIAKPLPNLQQPSSAQDLRSDLQPVKNVLAQYIREEFESVMASGDYIGRESDAAAQAVKLVAERTPGAR